MSRINKPVVVYEDPQSRVVMVYEGNDAGVGRVVFHCEVKTWDALGVVAWLRADPRVTETLLRIALEQTLVKKLGIEPWED